MTMAEETLEIRSQGRTEEAALIAACMRKPALLDEMKELVYPSMFGWKAYQDAWEAMLELQEQGSGIDPVTVGDELERRGRLEMFIAHDINSFTGRAALSVVRERGQPMNARTYAEIVQDYAAKRELLRTATRLAEWAINGRRAVDILADMEKELLKIHVTGSSKAAKHTAGLADAVLMAVERTDQARDGEISYIPTYYPDLDRLVTGFSEPDLWVVAARPGMGKTALLASIAMNVIEKGKKVVFFTLEMGMAQIAMRMISMLSGVPYSEQLTGKMSEETRERYDAAVNELLANSSGVYLNDLPAISPQKIRQELRRIGEVDLVVLDYIQLASADQQYDVRNLEVAAIVKGLKEICKEFHVPMLAAAQLNRAVEQRSEKMPILSDLGESDELGKSADKVLFIHREEGSSNAMIIVAKQRNGPTGITSLTYLGAKTRFVSQAKVR